MRKKLQIIGDGNGASLAIRALFWLFAIFSVAETPLGRGDLYGAGGRLIDIARLELLSGDLPARYSTAGSRQGQTSSIELYQAAASACAVETTGGDFAIAATGSTAIVESWAAARAPSLVAASTGFVHPGYSSRAPPRRA